MAYCDDIVMETSIVEDSYKPKNPFVRHCWEVLTGASVLPYDVNTLLCLFDKYNENEEDFWTLEVTGENMHPVKCCVLMTLIHYENKEELEFFMETSNHVAISIVKKAKERMNELTHAPFPVEIDVTVVCDCPSSAPSVNMCHYCNVYVCSDCTTLICPILLNRFMFPQETVEVEMEEKEEASSEDIIHHPSEEVI